MDYETQSGQPFNMMLANLEDIHNIMSKIYSARLIANGPVYIRCLGLLRIASDYALDKKDKEYARKEFITLNGLIHKERMTEGWNFTRADNYFTWMRSKLNEKGILTAKMDKPGESLN